MSRRISDSVREKILRLRAEGLSMRVIAERLGVSSSVVHKVLSEAADE